MKVLIVDDVHDSSFEESLRRNGIETVWALNLQEGWEKFTQHSDIDLVVMDCCVDNTERPDSMPLVQKIRAKGFTKPIVAISSIPAYFMELIEAGASHGSTRDKSLVPLIIELLDL